jgi:acetylornithine deacetylase/succinyl-diaminopimelate desuccinylase-like protein
MTASPERIAEWVSRLVRIPSVNPLHAGPNAGAPGERAVAEELAGVFEGFGASEVVLDTLLDDRPNVYGFFPGRSDRLVVVDVHTDTVTVENMVQEPFDGRLEDGRVWGRGALDTKATLGVLCALLEEAAREGRRPEPNLLVVGSISEESGGLVGAIGFRAWAEGRGLRIDEMVVAEPTMCAPIYGHKGGVAALITVNGRSAHSSTPHLGANAIVGAAHVVLALQAEHERLISIPPTTDVGTGTLTVALIEGGSAPNIVPDRCSVHVGRRIAPYEDPSEEYERIASLAASACPLPVDVEPVVHYPTPDGPGSPAFYQTPDTTLIRNLAGWAGTEPTTAPFGTNALRYDGFAGAMAVFGPGSIEDAHRETESVSLAELARTAAVYRDWLRL